MFTPNKPSRAETDRLLLAKRAYLLAVNHRTERHDPAARIAAVVLFDFAIESTMKLAVEVLGNTKVAREFPAVLQQLDNAISKLQLPPLASRQAMLKVHETRNASQHSSRYPNETEMAECLIYSRDSLRELVGTVWDSSFDSLCLSRLVRDDHLRKLLQEAEGAIEGGSWVEAVSKASYAVQSALGDISMHTFGEPTYLNEELENSERGADLNRTISQLAKFSESTLLGVSLGLDIKAIRRIRAITGDWVTVSGTNVRYHHIRPHLTEGEALFVLDASLTAVLKIEEEVGNIQQPFGIDIWSEDTVDEFAIRNGVTISSLELPEIPQAGSITFDRETVDRNAHLRRHRAIAALRNASAALDPSNRRHSELLTLIDQYVMYINHYGSDIDFETGARRLLAIISSVRNQSTDGAKTAGT
ncbi:hypothetical protein [Streptomyces griseorubiginosus]|uniref:hypothetical protein n=1 Tax=Streptomyces griseorubiginosus TaxID=67304 RepID=UPI0011407FBC|nr:hypothetical protein [Streptomyces griseorubiginosus]